MKAPAMKHQAASPPSGGITISSGLSEFSISLSNDIDDFRGQPASNSFIVGTDMSKDCVRTQMEPVQLPRTGGLESEFEY